MFINILGLWKANKKDTGVEGKDAEESIRSAETATPPQPMAYTPVDIYL